VNKRKKAGTSRDASSPKAPTAQAWRDAAKTAKQESVDQGVAEGFFGDMKQSFATGMADKLKKAIPAQHHKHYDFDSVKSASDTKAMVARARAAGHLKEQGVAEEWSQKYKSSINCSHPKGFSQKAHCAGKKKHNESIEMEMVCEDCGMCQTHGTLNEIKKGAKDSNGYTKCWSGYHAAGTKKSATTGKQVRNCVPNEGVAEGGYSRYDNNRTGFGKRPREDDEYHVPDPVETKYNIKVNGAVINHKPFANRAAAVAWAKQAVADGKLDPKNAVLSPINQVNELSTDKLAQYKKAAGADASAADKRGDIERGNKRFKGIVKATIKQGNNDAKKHKDVAEGFDDVDPVTGAITRRILSQRLDLLKQYGPELVGAAVDKVADYVGDVEEIGSSDVSGWVVQVERMLKENPPEAFAEDDVEDFLKAGGKITYGKPQRGPRRPGLSLASRHIGGGGDKMRMSRTGRAANTQGSKVVATESYWNKLQDTRNTKVASLITELTESIKDIK
jgi:hypothetical protein